MKNRFSLTPLTDSVCLDIMVLDEKSTFVDPSHRFCVSRCDAFAGFGVFSENTHTLWCFSNNILLLLRLFSDNTYTLEDLVYI